MQAGSHRLTTTKRRVLNRTQPGSDLVPDPVRQVGHMPRLPGNFAPPKRPINSPSHLITSSAVASSEGRTSRPSCFAVLTLIASKNLVGCSIGNASLNCESTPVNNTPIRAPDQVVGRFPQLAILSTSRQLPRETRAVSFDHLVGAGDQRDQPTRRSDAKHPGR